MGQEWNKIKYAKPSKQEAFIRKLKTRMQQFTENYDIDQADISQYVEA